MLQVTYCKSKQINPDGRCFFVVQTLKFVFEILREGLEINLPKW